MESICFTEAPVMITGIATSIITVASVLANIVNKDTVLGKVIHLLAVNVKVSK